MTGVISTDTNPISVSMKSKMHHRLPNAILLSSSSLSALSSSDRFATRMSLWAAASWLQSAFSSAALENTHEDWTSGYYVQHRVNVTDSSLVHANHSGPQLSLPQSLSKTGRRAKRPSINQDLLSTLFYLNGQEKWFLS